MTRPTKTRRERTEATDATILALWERLDERSRDRWLERPRVRQALARAQAQQSAAAGEAAGA